MTRKNEPAPVVRRTRRIPAPPRDVYRAWLDPALLARWMAPGLEVTRAEVDARVGGHLRIWHAEAGVPAGGFECEIVELVADERLVFRWGFVGPERARGPAYDSLLTVTLRAVGDDATELTLVHERLDDLAAARPDIAEQVDAGWRIVLDQLAVILDPEPREGSR